MMTESVETAKYTRPGNPLAVPDISLAASSSSSTAGAGAVSNNVFDSALSKRNQAQSSLRIVDRDDQEHVVFRLLTRTPGHKSGATTMRSSQTRDLYVPLDTDLALSTVHNEQTLRAEKDELKRLVLAGLRREEMNERELDLQRAAGRVQKRDNTVDLDFSHRSYDPSLTIRP
jgi:hypothetical protein